MLFPGFIAGMGTEVQSKMYLPGPGYYTIRDLDDNAINGSWNLHHETRALKSGQYYEMFLTGPSIEGYSGYDKQQMRQTILNHEVTFRHQVCFFPILFRYKFEFYGYMVYYLNYLGGFVGF